MSICFRVLAALVATGLCCASASAQMDHDAHSGPTMNHHVINDQLATGGHIVGDGLQTLTGEGYTVVIDLRDEPPGDAGEDLEAIWTPNAQWVAYMNEMARTR